MLSERAQTSPRLRRLLTETGADSTSWPPILLKGRYWTPRTCLSIYRARLASDVRPSWSSPINASRVTRTCVAVAASITRLDVFMPCLQEVGLVFSHVDTQSAPYGRDPERRQTCIFLR